MNAIAVLLIMATLGLFARVWVPWGGRSSGNLVRRETLSLFGRLRMHGQLTAVLFVIAIVCFALGWIDPLTMLAVLALLVLLLALPVRYTLTARGIRAGWTPFRRWTEFGGVARRPGGVRLQGVAGARPLTVWLSGGRDDDDFVFLLRQLVRGSYKGQLGPDAGVAVAGGASGALTSPGPGPVGIAGAGGD
jgi:hypothetical protein